MFEYQVLTWQGHRPTLLLAKLNELGAEGWEIVGTIGNTIILCRRTDSESESTLDPFDKLEQLGNVPLGDWPS